MGNGREVHYKGTVCNTFGVLNHFLEYSRIITRYHVNQDIQSSTMPRLIFDSYGNFIITVPKTRYDEISSLQCLFR